MAILYSIFEWFIHELSFQTFFIKFMEGFPVPNFDFVDESDISSCFEVNNCITSEECDKIFGNSNDLVVDTKTPIKSTPYSTVYAAKSPLDGELFAIKVTDQKHRVQTEYIKRKQIPDSPYLLKTISFQETPSKGIIQMELCEEGDIKGLHLKEEYVWKLVHDIGMALFILHNDRWMHLDVSPGNILIGHSCFKLSDFGTLTRFGNFEEGMEGAGPYVSPEALSYPNSYEVGPATDIFSFGVVLLEVITGKPAPRGGTPSYQLIRNGKLNIDSGYYACHCSQPLKELIKLMLSPNPHLRPAAECLASIY